MGILIGIFLLVVPFLVLGVIISLLARVRKLEDDVRELTEWLARETATKESTDEAVHLMQEKTQVGGGEREVPAERPVHEPTPYSAPVAAPVQTQQAVARPIETESTPSPVSAQAHSNAPQGMPIFPTSPAESTPLHTDNGEEDADARVVAWFKENWLMKIGAIFLIMGFGWLVSYAFANDWIGPFGRIMLGLVVGALFMAGGWWRIRSYRDQGSVFIVLGSTIVLLVTYAGQSLYALMPVPVALLMMFASAAFVAFASVHHQSRGLAITSLIMASIAPLLVGAPEANYLFLFSYLLMVVLGTVWVVALSGYRELSLGALIIVFFYSIPHLTGVAGAELTPLFMLAILFSGIFFATSVLGVLRLPKEKSFTDILTAGGNGIFLLLWIMAAVSDPWQSAAVLLAAILFVSAAFMVYRATERPEPFLTYLGVGIVMVATATALEFDGAALTIAYIVESAIAVVTVYVFLGRDVRIAARVGVLFVLPGFLSLPSFFSSAWRDGVLHADFFVLSILGLSLMGVATLLLMHRRDDHDETSFALTTTLLVIGTLYIHSIFWQTFPTDGAIQLLAIALWSFVFVGFAFLVRRLCGDEHSLYPYLFLSGGMMLIAFAQYISGPWLTILYTLQAIVVVTTLHVLVRNTGVTLYTSLVLAFPALMSLRSITSGAWDDGVLHADLLVLLALGATLMTIAGYFYRVVRASQDEQLTQLCGILFVAGTLYFYVALWLSLHALLANNDIAVMLSLAVYTVIGIATYFWGLHHGVSQVRWYGAVLLSFVIGRLLLVDVWDMAIVGRIITFFTIGTLLVATAFVSRERKREEVGAPSSEQS